MWENYPILKSSEKKNIGHLFNAHNDKIIVVKNERINAVGFYFRLTDETYNDLKNRKINLITLGVFQKCLEENGKNIHFAFTVANGFRSLREGIREVIRKEKPLTVSWYNSKMTKFFNRKVGVSCPQPQQQSQV